jgi:hypothetical protein
MGNFVTAQLIEISGHTAALSCRPDGYARLIESVTSGPILEVLRGVFKKATITMTDFLTPTMGLLGEPIAHSFDTRIH